MKGFGELRPERGTKEQQQQLEIIRKKVFEEDKLIVEKQVLPYKQMLELKDFRKMFGELKIKAQNEVKHIQSQAADVEVARKQNEANSQEQAIRQRMKRIEEEYVRISRERAEVVATMQLKGLAILQIEDKKSKANEVFKWLLVAFYLTPESKYYWPNFTEQVFQVDQGKDFLQRLSKLGASQVKEEQRLKTEWFLRHFEQIREAPELSTVSESMKQFKIIAELYLRSIALSRDLLHNQELLEEDKTKKAASNQEHTRSLDRAGAIADRKQVLNSTVAYLRRLIRFYDTKDRLYHQKIQEGEVIQKRLTQNSNSRYTPVLSTNEDFGNCSCAIY